MQNTLKINVVILAVFLQFIGWAQAHPHVLIDAKMQVHINVQQQLTHISHSWTFDESFSTFALQGLARNKEGNPTIEVLKPLAKVNIISMKEYGYFTFLATKKADKYEDMPAEMAPDEKYFLTYNNKKLTLHFNMVLKTPLNLKQGDYALDVYDPEYFVAFTLLKNEVKLSDTSSKSCSVFAMEPKPLDKKLVDKLAQLPADIRELPSEFSDLSEQFTNRILLKCS